MSLCAFSITLAASATLTFLAINNLDLIIFYRFFKTLTVFKFEPEITFEIFPIFIFYPQDLFAQENNLKIIFIKYKFFFIFLIIFGITVSQYPGKTVELNYYRITFF